jgi:hypothetical protein
MNNVITRRAEMFVRVENFLSERAASFTPGTLGGEVFADIKSVVQTLTGAAAKQASGVSSVHQATTSRAVAREALRENMQSVARTARAMALDTPGLENKFRLPRSGSDTALLQAARAFVTDAVSFKDEFIRHDMPQTFVEDLQSDIDDLQHTIEGQNTGRDAHVSATAFIESVIERGMSAVRKLDAIVRNKFRDDPATLAAWESARHTESSARTRRRTNGNAKPSNRDAGVEKNNADTQNKDGDGKK